MALLQPGFVLDVTFVVLHPVQQANALKMFRCGHRQGQNITDGLVESRVGAVTEGDGLIFILQEVLNVSHLVVYGDEVVHGHHRALLDPRNDRRMEEVHGEVAEITRGKEKTRSSCCFSANILCLCYDCGLADG